MQVLEAFMETSDAYGTLFSQSKNNIKQYKYLM